MTSSMKNLIRWKKLENAVSIVKAYVNIINIIYFVYRQGLISKKLKKKQLH